jgi:hypothetical protein
MKAFAIILVFLEIIYLCTVKVAVFMLSLLTIVFSGLLIQNTIQNAGMLDRLSRRKVRV